MKSKYLILFLLATILLTSCNGPGGLHRDRHLNPNQHADSPDT